MTQLTGEDRKLIPDTCFLLPFEVDKGPDPALLPLPQVYDRHRRRLKQGSQVLICVHPGDVLNKYCGSSGGGAGDEGGRGETFSCSRDGSPWA